MADISQITLPSGTTYDIKDTVARAGVSSGGIFVIAWNGLGEPVVSNIPLGVVVRYNNQNYTGTRAASANDLKQFVLVAAASQESNQEVLDIYDEYVVIDNGEGVAERYTWEKIGDTQVKLTAMVTGVTLNKSTNTVIGSDATIQMTAQATYSVTPKTTYIGASASGGAVSASGDNVTAVTGYASPASDTFLKKVTANKSKLVTTSIIGVTDNVTTASKATEGNSQTTISGLTDSTSNTDLLANCTVSGEILVIRAKAPQTQTTTQFTFESVNVPVKASSTTVATGALAANASGDEIATDVTISGTGYTASALTGLGNPTTDSVIGASSTFTVTNPTITLNANDSTATGRVAVASNEAVNASKTANAAIGWANKDTKTVLNNSTDITVSRPN